MPCTAPPQNPSGSSMLWRNASVYRPIAARSSLRVQPNLLLCEVTGWKNLAAGSDAGELGATCIAGFAVTTFVPSMPSACPINKENEPAAFSTTFVNGQFAVPAGGQIKVPTPRADYFLV